MYQADEATADPGDPTQETATEAVLEEEEVVVVAEEEEGLVMAAAVLVGVGVLGCPARFAGESVGVSSGGRGGAAFQRGPVIDGAVCRSTRPPFIPTTEL